MFVHLCREVLSIELKFYSLSVLSVELDVAVKFCQYVHCFCILIKIDS